MRLVTWLFVVVAVFTWSESGQAEFGLLSGCGAQLATRIGAKGATTLVLSPQGQLETWTDGFLATGGTRISNPFIQSTKLPVGSLNAITGLAAEILPDGSQTILGVAESNGAVSLISPMGNSYPFLSSELGAVTAVSFQSSADGKTITLYVGAGLRLYRLTMTWRAMDPEDRAMQSMLMTGLVKVTTVKATLPGERDKIRFAIPDIAAFDFSGEAKYLLASLSPSRALEITDFEKVLTFKDESRMKQIDFFSPLEGGQAVVGSKFGQMLLVDVAKKETELTLNFPGMGLVDSLSAHRIGKQIEVWATDSLGNLYRWQSQEALNQFRKVPFGGETTVKASKVTTVAFTAPRGYTPGVDGREGFLSQVEIRGNDAVVERVIVLGSDGNLYGYVEPINGIITGASQREWLKVEKPH